MSSLPPKATAELAKGAESLLSKTMNGKVLDVAQYAANINTIHPSMHRLLNATFLTAGLFGGRKVMDLLTGETPTGHQILKEDVPEPLRPLHGILAYNHYSDHPSDRWMKVLDLWTPAVMGAIGAVGGSHVFALDQKFVTASKAALHIPKGLSEEATKVAHMEMAKNLTLDTAERAALMTQSKPWRMLSGVTSLFGSAAGFQLIPGPTNYGSTLGASFLGTVERNKLHTPYMPWLQEFISANKHPFPYGPTGMLNKLRDYIAHNPSHELKQAETMAYAVLEPWFGKNVTPEHVEKFVEDLTKVRDKFLRDGGVPEELQASLVKELTEKMSGIGLEKTIQQVGLNPANATVGHNGFIEKFSRVLGYDKTLTRIGEDYRMGALMRSGQSVDQLANLAKHDENKVMRYVGRTLAGGSVAAVAAGAFNAQYWHKRDNDTLLRRALGKTTPDSPEAIALKQEQADLEANKKEVFTTSFQERVEHEHERDHQHHHEPTKPNNVISAVAGGFNDKPLAIAEWGADALNSPTTFGMHRVYCAGGLSLGGFIGMKIMEVLTGRTLGGSEVHPEKVPEFLSGLYKKLAYNPHSDHPKDRWGYVAHFLVPGLFATAGVVGASSFFFKDKVEKAGKAEYLDEFETRATMDQAGPWTSLTALTSLFVTPGGFGFLPPPAPNYGTALGTRFNLSAGRKVILPVVGDIWTDTQSRYPLGPPRLLDLMIKYAVNNPEAHPEQLEEMALGIIKPWFKDATKEQIEDFIRRVEADRNKFLECGGIPEEMRDDAEAMLRTHFKGAGLEETLKSIGLDPAEATLGQNGLSGKIAEYLGGGDALAETKAKFKKRYQERQAAKNDDTPGQKEDWWEPKRKAQPANDAAPTKDWDPMDPDRLTKSDAPQLAQAEPANSAKQPDEKILLESPTSELSLSQPPKQNAHALAGLDSAEASRHLSV